MGCSHSNEKINNRIVVNNSSEKLNEEQIEQLLQIRFNHSEILDWYRIFLEKCGSQFSPACINKILFIDYFNQLHPNGDVKRLTEIFFRTYDLNNDGMIDFMEFMHIISIIHRGNLNEKLSFIFSLLDFNQQGYIDRLKLIQMMEALYNIKGINYTDGYNLLLRKVDNIIIRLDKDKDGGQISKDKFIDNCINDPVIRDLIN